METSIVGWGYMYIYIYITGGKQDGNYYDGLHGAI